MPKFGGHIIIGEEVGKRLGYTESDLRGEIGNALRLGAVGPDLTLFLLDPAEDNKFVYQALGAGMRVYNEIRKVRDKIEEINTYIGKPAAEIASWFSGGFSDSLLEFSGMTVNSFVAALQYVAFTTKKIEVLNPFNGMDAGVLSKVFGPEMFKWATAPKLEVSWNYDSSQITSPAYIFRHFGAPYTDDPPFKEKFVVGDYSKWWWMDILHYRRTGQFARTLQDFANHTGDPILIAYANGYFSHVGGDIVGHPYVNSIVGGPFRNHALRHMVVESLLDVQIWKDYKAGAEIFNSRMDKVVNVSDESLKSISELFHKCLDYVFVNPGIGGRLFTQKISAKLRPKQRILLRLIRRCLDISVFQQILASIHLKSRRVTLEKCGMKYVSMFKSPSIVFLSTTTIWALQAVGIGLRR